MKIIIIIELIINYILLLIFNTHMLQLNSYFFLKHFKWMRKNIKKLLLQLILVIPTILIYFNNTILNIAIIIILGISIIYNIPKRNSKISLKYTGRVKRLIFTDMLISLLILFVGGIRNYIITKLIIINVFANMLIILSNLVNHPIEMLGRKRYINDAKRILNEMPNLLVIGITGSYGKTSMKNFLYSLLSEKYDVLKTPKNYNTTMGVVKTIREELKPTHQIFLCEMGATNIGDIKEICDIVIIDGTPCELVTDSIILSRLVDSTIIVTAHKQTKKDVLQKTVTSIQNVGGKIAGIVLNKIPISNKKYEQAYYYGSTGSKIKGTRKKSDMTIRPSAKRSAKVEEMKSRINPVNPQSLRSQEAQKTVTKPEPRPATRTIDNNETLEGKLKVENKEKISMEKSENILKQINEYLNKEKNSK